MRQHQLSFGLGKLRFWQQKRQLAQRTCSFRTEPDVRNVAEQALSYTHRVQLTACMLSGRVKPLL